MEKTSTSLRRIQTNHITSKTKENQNKLKKEIKETYEHKTTGTI